MHCSPDFGEHVYISYFKLCIWQSHKVSFIKIYFWRFLIYLLIYLLFILEYMPLFLHFPDSLCWSLCIALNTHPSQF